MPDPCPSSGDPRVLPAAAPPARQSCRERELVALVHSARAGDSDAWTRLVRRYDRMLRHIARSYRLAPAEVDDVLQTTWLSLFEAIEQIRDPTAIGAWLATATRRAALRRIQSHVRERLTDDPQLGDRPDGDQPETILLARERRAFLTDAIAKLPDRHRDLVTVLLTQPTLEYREVAELLSMPTGSIGPIRARSLARLARDAQLRSLSESREACR
jgi:RNA polymerase sigma factor (sigma-70 family)